MGTYDGGGEMSYKWLPDINLDKCTGCGKCVKACSPKSLVIVNEDFALLMRADTCSSGGHCVESCPEDALNMEWIEMRGEHAAGDWMTITEL